jgi:hypothetical protein
MRMKKADLQHLKYKGKFVVTADGGYPLVYITRDGESVCPKCADKDVDRSQEVISADVNWEDPDLYCDDCGTRIPSAYSED